MPLLRPVALALFAVLLSLAFADRVAAQDYPNRPIRLVVPFGPGSASDTIARIVSDKLGNLLGQRVLIENRAGAGGNIGTDAVAKADPDGYTLVLAAPGPFAINKTLDSLPYDPERDFEFITPVTMLVNVLVVNPKVVPVSNVAEFVRFVKERPNKVAYASVGRGSSQHLAGAYFDMVAGTRMVHVPYRSGSQIAVDLVSGDVGVNFALIPNVSSHLASGQLKPLAVTTKIRSKSLPEVPTMAEEGVSDYESYGWFGIAAPNGTPKPIIDRLHSELVRVIADPTTQARLIEIGTEPLAMSPAEFKTFVSSEVVKWRDIIRSTGIKSD